MNKIYTDSPEPLKAGIPDLPTGQAGEPKTEPVKKPEPKKEGLNKLLLGLIVVLLIAVVTYFIIQQNKKDNG